MLPNKPYLIRAFYQWIVDSGCVPIVVINAYHPRCKIPQDYVEGGEIIFNIAPSAIRDLKMTNESIEFKASFSGVIHIVAAPVQAILAIYAEENGEGLFFDAEEDDVGTTTPKLKRVDDSASKALVQEITSRGVTADNKKGKPFLKLVE